MTRERLLWVGSLIVSVGIILVAIRTLAPQWMEGGPDGLPVVQVDGGETPFFDAVFSELDATTHFLNEPYVGHRRRALVPENGEGELDGNAPFDLLGFHNRSIPVVADIITMGNSHTVGPGVPLDWNWPAFLLRNLGDKEPVLYNMGQAGWGAIHTLHMFDKAVRFRPRVVVVALHTGGDTLKSVHMAYSMDVWKHLRPGHSRPKSSPVVGPSDVTERWNVKFADGVKVVFDPVVAMAPNDRNYPGTLEGLEIMGEAARLIDRMAGERGIPVIFTIIPTKELVYVKKVRRDGLVPPGAYVNLVEDETQNIKELSGQLDALPNSIYVDMLASLQQAAMDANQPLYPRGVTGYPGPLGFKAYAAPLTQAVDRLLPGRPQPGLFRTLSPDGRTRAFYRVFASTVARFENEQTMRDNGWATRIEAIPSGTDRDLAHLHYRGIIKSVDSGHWGPKKK